MTDNDKKFSPDEVLMGGVMMIASGMKVMKKVTEAAEKEEGVTLTWEEAADLSFMITMAVAGAKAGQGNVMREGTEYDMTLKPGPYL